MTTSRLISTLAFVSFCVAPAFAQQRMLVQGGERLAILAADGSVEWEMPWGATRQMHVLPNGNLLVERDAHEVVEIERTTKSIVWSYDARAQLHSFQPLSSGNLLVVAGTPAKVLEVDRLGRDQSERSFDSFGAQVQSVLIMDDGPEAALLQRAQRIHRAALTLDTHKDISITLASPEVPEDPVAAEKALLGNDPTVWGTNQVDFPKMIAGGLDVAFYIVYVAQASLDDEGFAAARAQANEKFEAIERMARRYPEHIEIAHSADDVERIAAAGKLVACIGIENGYAMGEDISAIEEFHRRGARYMSITHNRHSQLGDSNTPEGAPLHGGLSDLGRQAIEEMNRVGIMVDISHAGEITTLQAIEHSKAPVIASHSGVDAVRFHGRNLSDAELLALKKNGGVLQCVAFASYVTDSVERDTFVNGVRAELGIDSGDLVGADRRRAREVLREKVRAYDKEHGRANVADFANHIDYAVEVMGIEHVAISSDFDGGGGVDGWNDASETFNVTLELVRRGYSDEDIHKLWSGNTLRVWRAVEEVAKELAAESK